MNKKQNGKKLFSSREFSLVFVLIIICFFVQLRNNSFLTASNITDMLNNNFWIFIPTLGMLGVLLIGGIDISIGSTVAFSGMSVGLLMRDYPSIPTPVLFFVGILIGTALGGIVGLTITKGKVIPIIATMGFMNIFRGATYLIANNQWVAAYQVKEDFKAFALGKTFGISNYIMIIIVCYLIFFYFMKYTTLGRRIYATGSNPEAAKVSGINLNKISMMVYSIMGGLCGLTGVLWVAKYASAQGDAAKGMEMDIIAACVIGGVSLSGGRGSVIGVLLGSLIMAILGNALPLINVSVFWQDAIKGIIILIAVVLNVLTQRSMQKNNLKRSEMSRG